MPAGVEASKHDTKYVEEQILTAVSKSPDRVLPYGQVGRF